MAKDDKIELEGIVEKVNKGTVCDVKLIDTGTNITCTLSGRLRKNFIRILQGDKVTIAMSPYDLSKGIITWRH